MIRASHTRRTSGVSINTSALEIYSTGQRGFWLREVELYLTVATSSTYSIRRTTTLGQTPGTIHGTPWEESDVVTALGGPLTLSATTWGTPPVVGSARWTCVMPATIGATIRKTWTSFWVPVGKSVVLYNDAANGVVDCNFTIDEVP